MNENWQNLNTKTAADFFNGVNGARFDYSNWVAFLSVKFSLNSDALYLHVLDWQAATGAGANNGSLTLWIDGTQRASLTGVSNDTRRIETARFVLLRPLLVSFYKNKQFVAV